jgi:hypothetical protein
VDWKIDSKESVSFRSTASLEDFLEVRLNGEVVPRTGYLLKEGSTIVELTPTYLKSLEDGVYTLEIVSTTGTAMAEFSVSESNTVWWWVLAVAGVVAVGIAVWLPVSRKKNRAHLALVANEIEICLKKDNEPMQENACIEEIAPINS